MITRKEIAARDDVDVSPWTVKRWMRKFKIKPDQRGHGPDKYKHTTATRFVKLFNDANNQRGTTPQITRAKFDGTLTDTDQLPLPLNFNAIKKAIGQKIQIARKAVRTDKKHRRRS